VARTGELDPKLWPEIRGLILRYIYRQERKKKEVVFLRTWAFVHDEGYKITPEDLGTALADMSEAGHISFKKEENPRTGEVRHQNIRTTTKGRNLVEETGKDPSIRIDIVREADE